jgi:hypothetical protein
MYINSTSESLHDPSFKSLVSAKKFGYPQWPTGQYKFQVQITRRILNRIRKKCSYIKQGPKWGRLVNKTRGQKSHATVPLIESLLLKNDLGYNTYGAMHSYLQNKKQKNKNTKSGHSNNTRAELFNTF